MPGALRQPPVVMSPDDQTPPSQSGPARPQSGTDEPAAAEMTGADAGTTKGQPADAAPGNTDLGDAQPGDAEHGEAASGTPHAEAGSTPAVLARLRDESIAEAILRLTGKRAPDRSICPSEAARDVAAAAGRTDWPALMGNVRRIALRLQAAGEVEILRKGRPVPADQVRGVIRLRRAAASVTPAVPASAGPADAADDAA